MKYHLQLYQNNKIVCDNQEVNDMHTENCKHDWNKNMRNQWKDTLCLYVGGINIIKRPILPKEI